MTSEYEIYPEARMIVTRYSGTFTFAALRDFVHRMWADPRYSRSYDGMVDVTDVSFGVSRGDLLALIDLLRGNDKTSEGRWAAVTTSPMTTALGLIYQRAMVGRHAFEVFSTQEAAEWFLGVDFGGATMLQEGSAPRRRN